MIRHHAIYNFSEATLDSSVTHTGLYALADIANRHITNREPDGRSAHVSSNTDTLGVQNIFASIIQEDGCPYEQGVFNSLDEALKWFPQVFAS